MTQWVALLCISDAVAVQMGEEFVLFSDDFESLNNLGGAVRRRDLLLFKPPCRETASSNHIRQAKRMLM